MSTESPRTPASPARRWLRRIGLAWLLCWLCYASPLFLASMALRVALGEPMPRSISRMPGPWGDGYLVIDDAADGFYTLYSAWGHVICAPGGGLSGDGDGECPHALSERWVSIPVW
ncbi:MAG: DUF6970 domain-containing protein [Pseudomonadota bacterium]